MNNGFSFTEVLLALLLGTLLFVSALSCHWFARQQLAVSLEHQAAGLLLTEARHLLHHSLNSQLPATPVPGRMLACVSCDQAQRQQLNMLNRLLAEAPAALAQPELCLWAGAQGPVLLLSWRSVAPASYSYPYRCGGGEQRRQLMSGVLP